MNPHTVSDLVASHKKWKRTLLIRLLRHKSFRNKFCHSDFFFQHVRKASPIKSQPFETNEKIVMENCLSRNGNASPYELMILASLAKEKQPKNLLEIGTFDGNTTLQLALNTTDLATIHTIDLPQGEYETFQPVLESDLTFIRDGVKERRKFNGHPAGRKVIQHFGDSTKYDFSSFTKEGLLDFIFVDGGHSYECVKSDTEQSLKHLSTDGWVLWHDFTPQFGGVYNYLCELSHTLPLIHFEGTNLVIYKKECL